MFAAKILSSLSGNIPILKTSTNIFNLSRFKMASTEVARQNLLFRQLFDKESCTYTYLLADKSTKEAILIDPVIEQGYRDAKLIMELELKLIYVMNTHIHADHITGTGILKSLIPECQSVLSQAGGGKADILVNHGDKVRFGDQKLEIRSTPGHTNGCLTFVDHKNEMAFTGDAILIRGCGRTDFQDGCAKKLYSSIHSQIFSLPRQYLIYPAHDYSGQSVTTVEEEQKLNERVTKSEKDFIKLMNNLNLPYPKRIDESLPANKVCGLYNLPEALEKMLEKAKPLENSE